MNQPTTTPDSVRSHWFATNLYFIYKYDLFPRNKYIDLFAGLGPQLGVQCFAMRKNDLEFYRNINLALVPHLELRFQPLRRIPLGASAEFLFDITGSRWKTFDSRDYRPNSSRFTGTALRFFAGWCWGH